jgi:TolB protein
MSPIGKHSWSAVLALTFCVAAGHGQNSKQDVGGFEAQGDIGTVLHPGSSHYDAVSDTYTITGSGVDLWRDEDSFHFVWQKMSGDVSMSADIDFVGEKGNAHRKAVLMIRQSLDPRSTYVDVARHGDGLTSLQFRDATGAATHEIETYDKGPHRVEIEKRGDYAYVSILDTNGKMAPSGAAMRVAIQGGFYVGLGVSSHDKDATQTATFSKVKVDRLPPPAGQPVLYSTLESVIVSSTDRRVRYTAPIRFEDPNWTPDGKALIFNQEGTLQRFTLDDGIHPIDSTLPRSQSSAEIPINPASKLNGDHGISPDGTQIAIGSQDLDGTARVYVVPIDGGTPRRVTPDGPAYFHGWSPDSKTITFTKLRGESFGAYSVPIAGGPETLIGANSDSAEFSPDGKWISFQSDSTGHMQIWRMHPDGSAKEQLLVSETSDWFPHISPDGTLIAFLSYAPGTQDHPADQDVEIRVLSLADKKVRTVAKLLGGRGTMNVPSWSPDSKMLAFTSYEFLPQ